MPGSRCRRSRARRVTVPVPAGTSSGQKLRVRGKGVPARDDAPAGDLFVVLKIVVPKSVEEAGARAHPRVRRPASGPPPRGPVVSAASRRHRNFRGSPARPEVREPCQPPIRSSPATTWPNGSPSRPASSCATRRAGLVHAVRQGEVEGYAPVGSSPDLDRPEPPARPRDQPGGRRGGGQAPQRTSRRSTLNLNDLAHRLRDVLDDGGADGGA